MAKVRSSRAIRIGASAFGAIATGAFALGALAVGSLVIGRLGIGRLVGYKASFKSLNIDELVVNRLRVGDLEVSNALRLPEGASLQIQQQQPQREERRTA